MKTILITALFISTSAFAAQEPAASLSDQSRYLAESKSFVEKMTKAQTLNEKLEVLRALDKRTKEEREKTEKAVTSGLKAKNLPELEAKELEAIRWMLSFEQVFDAALAKDFADKPDLRKARCKSVPEDIKLQQMPATGEAYDLSEYRKLAIETMTQLCK